MRASLPRSPLLMSAHDTGVLVVDMQTKLLDLMDSGSRTIWNVRRVLDAAATFKMPILATEQYPRGLGPTDQSLTERLGTIPEKLHFSCGERAELFEGLKDRGIRKMLVCGIETHVCVQQTVLDLLTAGFEIYVAVDAVGARFEIDHQTALGRMELSGATLTTTEAALFEWCEKAGTEEFKRISILVTENPPASRN